MKKQFLSILLCLCMVLMLCPATAFAEGETPEPIPQIAVTVDEPALGETPDFEPEFTATPADSVDLAGVSWWKISEDD